MKQHTDLLTMVAAALSIVRSLTRCPAGAPVTAPGAASNSWQQGGFGSDISEAVQENCPLHDGLR